MKTNWVEISLFLQEARETLKDPTYLDSLESDDFFHFLMLLTPQSYGSILEKRLSKRFGLIRLNNSDKSGGDFKDQYGGIVELKASLITTTNKYLNLVQIRPNKEINYYLAVAIDIREVDVKTEVYRISDADMHQELILMNACYAHGSREDNKNNQNPEYRMSYNVIDKNNKHYIRLQNYRQNHICLL